MSQGLYGHKVKGFKIKEGDIFMKVIYTPAGKAAEYSEYALNIYNGCNHGCKYCYVPKLMHKTQDEFLKVYPRKDIVNQVEKEASEHTGKKVLLSFVSDPYPEVEKEYGITRKILEIFLKYKITPVILTKSGYADRDFDILKRANGYYGATLTFIEERISKLWEPGASSPYKRIELLKTANDRGIMTWVSLEPIISEGDTLKLIDMTHEFVDEYKVGKLNYNPLASMIDWKRFHRKVVEKLEKHNKKYYIKNSLKLYA